MPDTLTQISDAQDVAAYRLTCKFLWLGQKRNARRKSWQQQKQSVELRCALLSFRALKPTRRALSVDFARPCCPLSKWKPSTKSMLPAFAGMTKSKKSGRMVNGIGMVAMWKLFSARSPVRRVRLRSSIRQDVLEDGGCVSRSGGGSHQRRG